MLVACEYDKYLNEFHSINHYLLSFTQWNCLSLVFTGKYLTKTQFKRFSFLNKKNLFVEKLTLFNQLIYFHRVKQDLISI